MNKSNLLISACFLALAGCATYHPTLATACFRPSTLTGFEVETKDQVIVNDGKQYWRVHLRGACPELSKPGVGYLVFSDEQSLRPWPNQPWLHGFGQVRGWPSDGFYANRSSDLMRVCSNRMSWAHPFSASGSPMTDQYASWGCRVDDVEPLWR